MSIPIHSFQAICRHLLSTTCRPIRPQFHKIIRAILDTHPPYLPPTQLSDQLSQKHTRVKGEQANPHPTVITRLNLLWTIFGRVIILKTNITEIDLLPKDPFIESARHIDSTYPEALIEATKSIHLNDNDPIPFKTIKIPFSDISKISVKHNYPFDHTSHPPSQVSSQHILPNDVYVVSRFTITISPTIQQDVQKRKRSPSSKTESHSLLSFDKMMKSTFYAPESLPYEDIQPTEQILVVYAAVKTGKMGDSL
ncbi:hypothetical protein BLNAU_16411 [Blattamonas nauphoetae]|uniref:Uncharacterized protein n=1 Tax=Blattamonas nauphoetae TaxID=2049346 RepID=A0ABQ9XEM5_9EUKA|nr:hypothetical protein BLNAU_16411 [Blattamonas nauphoetae]